MPSGYTIGAAHIQVLPSIRGLHRDLGRQLKPIKPLIPARVTPQLDKADVDRMSRDLDALGRQLAKARTVEADAAGKVRVAEAKLAEARATGRAKASVLAAAEERLGKASRELAAAQSSTVRLTEQETQARNRLADATVEADRGSRGLLASLQGISAGLRNLDDRPARRMLGSLTRIGVRATVTAGAVAALGSSLPALASVAGGLASIAGAAGLIPAAVGAAALAIGAVKLATSGLEEAFKPGQAGAEAMASLAPSARAFVVEVKRLGPAFTALRLDVQERLFREAGGHVRSLGGRYLPVMRGALGRVADSLNRGGRLLADYFALPSTTTDVTTALDGMTTGLDRATSSLRPLAQIWTDFTVVGSSFLPGMGDGVTSLTTRWAAFIRTARETGQLREWIQGGIDRLVQLKDIAGNVGAVFRSVYGAAKAAGVDALSSIRDLTGELATSLRSPEGAETLRTFFVGLRALVDGVKPGLRALGAAAASFVRDVAPLLALTGPAFSALAKSLAPVVSEAGKLASVVLPPLLIGLRFIAPVLGPAVVGLLAAYAAFKAWMILSTVISFVRAFIVGQTALNVVLAANPIGIVVLALVALAAALVFAYRNSETFRRIVQAAWAGIQITVSWAWDNAIRPVFVALDWYVTKVIGPAVLWLWRNVAKPAFEGIGSTVSWIWGNVLRPTFSALSAGVDAIARSFESGIAFIDRQWGRLQDIAAKPVNFVIGTVYNNGIRAVWNRIAGVVGLGSLDPLPLISFGGGGGSAGHRGQMRLAGGGVLGGYAPGVDSIPALLSPGEAVLVPELVRAIGPQTILAANAAASGRRPGGNGRYAGGGVLGRLEGIADTARDWTMGLVTDPLATIRRMFGDPAAQVRAAMGNSPFVRAIAGIPGRLVSAAAEWLTSKVQSVFGALRGGGFSGGGNWPPPVMGQLASNTGAAVEFVRRTFGISSIGTLGNRPNASDHPMGKALDVMIPAWQTPAGIGRGNQVASWFVANPKVFGTKYVIWRDQINSGRGWGPYIHPLGMTDNPTLQHRDHVHVSVYDDGGWLPPGYSTVLNDTGRPEPVFSPTQWDALRRGGSSYTINVHETSNPHATAQAVIRALRRHEQMQGL